MSAPYKKYPFEIWISTIMAAPALVLLLWVLYDLFAIKPAINLLLLVPVFGYSILFSLPLLVMLVIVFHLSEKRRVSATRRRHCVPNCN